MSTKDIDCITVSEDADNKQSRLEKKLGKERAARMKELVTEKAQIKNAKEKLKTDSEEFQAAKEHLDTLEDGSEIKATGILYDHYVDLLKRFKNPNIDPEGLGPMAGLDINSLSDLRKMADDLGDNELGDWLDTFESVDDKGNPIFLRDFSPEDLAKAAEDVRNRNKIDGFANNMDYFFHSMADRLKDSPSPEVRGLAQLLLTGRSTNSGAVNTMGADIHARTARNRWNDEYSNILSDNFHLWAEESGNPIMFYNEHRQPMMKEFNLFSYDVSHYMHSFENGNSAEINYSPAVMATGDDIMGFIARVKKEVTDAGWEVDVDSIFVNEKGTPLSATSRVKDIEVNRQLHLDYRGESMEKVYENVQGAITVANPYWTISGARHSMNTNSKLPDGERIEYDANDILRFEEFEAKYKKGGDNMSHIEVAELLELLKKNKIHSWTHNYAKTNVMNGMKRAQRPDAQSMDNAEYQSKLESEDWEKEARDLGINISESDFNLAKQAMKTVEARKNAGGTKVDSLKKKVAMDPTYTTKIDKDVERVGMVESDFNYMKLLSHDIRSIGDNQITNLAMNFGLAKVNITSSDKIAKAIESAKEGAGKIESKGLSESTIKDLEMVYRHFTATAQFDQSGIYHQVKRIAHNFSMLKLGKLFLNMGPEASSVVQLKRIFGDANVPSTLIRSYFNAFKAGKKGDPMYRSSIAFGISSSNTVNFVVKSPDAGLEFDINSRKPVDFNKRGTNVFSRGLDKLELYSQEASAIMVQTFRPIDVAMRQRVFIDFTQQILDASKTGGVKNLKPNQIQAALDAGIDDSFFDGINKMIDEGIFQMNADGILLEMDTIKMRDEHKEFFDRFSATSNKIVQDTIHTPDIGNSPPFVNTELFSFIGQFRSFSLGAYSNQLRYNLSKRDMITAQLMLWQWTMGSGVWAVTETLEGRAEELTIDNLMKAAIRRAGITAMMSTFIDSGLSVVGAEQVFSPFSSTNMSNGFDMNNNTVSSFVNANIDIFRSLGEVAQGKDGVDNVIGSFLNTYSPNFPGTAMIRNALKEE